MRAYHAGHRIAVAQPESGEPDMSSLHHQLFRMRGPTQKREIRGNSEFEITHLLLSNYTRSSRLILRSRPKAGVSKDERGPNLMVRDARLRRAPHHDAHFPHANLRSLGTLSHKGSHCKIHPTVPPRNHARP